MSKLDVSFSKLEFPISIFLATAVFLQELSNGILGVYWQGFHKFRVQYVHSHVLLDTYHRLASLAFHSYKLFVQESTEITIGQQFLSLDELTDLGLYGTCMKVDNDAALEFN